MAKGIIWASEARIHIARVTGKDTPLKALMYLMGLLNGDEAFVTLVAKAMETAYDMGSKARPRPKETKEVEK